METYANRIHMHLEYYYCEHYGKLPEVIFMSSELFHRLYNDIVFYDTKDGEIATFHRVPVKIYHSHELEYHFVERSGKLD